LRFCPECGSFCVNNHKRKYAVCSRCEYIVDLEPLKGIVNTRSVDEKLVVVDDIVKTLNGISRRRSFCPKCGYTEVYVKMGASNHESDFEAEILSCALCGYSWKDSL
jgi:DNA-directed RNA polymerase subunit M/transcription elongation factor TFIIS